jgi:hypothetical protein
MQIDEHENLYLLMLSGVLLKISPEWKLAAQRNVSDEDYQLIAGFSLLTSINGLLHIFYNRGKAPTYIETYDSTLSFVRSDTIPQQCNPPHMERDTFFFTVGALESIATSYYSILAYDRQGAFVRAWDVKGLVDKQCPASFGYPYLLSAPDFTDHSLSILCLGSSDGGSKMILLAVDSRNNLYGRCSLKSTEYLCDGVDRIYALNWEKRSIYVYKIN